VSNERKKKQALEPASPTRSSKHYAVPGKKEDHFREVKKNARYPGPSGRDHPNRNCTRIDLNNIKGPKKGKGKTQGGGRAPTNGGEKLARKIFQTSGRVRTQKKKKKKKQGHGPNEKFQPSKKFPVGTR